MAAPSASRRSIDLVRNSELATHAPPVRIRPANRRMARRHENASARALSRLSRSTKARARAPDVGVVQQIRDDRHRVAPAARTAGAVSSVIPPIATRRPAACAAACDDGTPREANRRVAVDLGAGREDRPDREVVEGLPAGRRQLRRRCGSRDRSTASGRAASPRVVEGRSSCPRCTPPAPATRAMSTRSLTMKTPSPAARQPPRSTPSSHGADGSDLARS